MADDTALSVDAFMADGESVCFCGIRHVVFNSLLLYVIDTVKILVEKDLCNSFEDFKKDLLQVRAAMEELLYEMSSPKHL